MGGRWWVVRVVAPPFLILAAVAWYLHGHWDQIPLRFPVHWSAGGVPNRWTNRSWRGVFGPLIAGGIMMIPMLAMCVALRYGARPGRGRSAATACLLAATYAICLSFSIIPLLPLVAIPVPLVPLAAAGALVAVVVWSVIRMKGPGAKPADPAPGDLFVPKGQGMGYTLNFRNPWSWVIIALFVLSIPAMILVLP